MRNAFAWALAVGLALVVLPSVPAVAQQGEGWVTLFDGKNLGDWDQVGESN